MKKTKNKKKLFYEFYPYPLATVGGLIVAPDNTILLVRSKKWNNHYSIPGGKIELGETREEAIVREIREETDLEVINLRFVGTQESIYSHEFWEKRHFLMNDFVADLDPRYDKSKVHLNGEAQKFRWVTIEEAKNLPLHREVRNLIEWYDKNG